MLTLPAKTVYVDPAIYDRPNCRARLERVLPHIRCDDVRPYDASAREAVRQIPDRRHGKDNFGDDAVLVFSAWDPDRAPFFQFFRDGADSGQNHGGVCQSAVELNLVFGCAFRCAYCGFGRCVRFSLDVERFVDELEGAFAKHPAQTLWKFSNMTDLPAFEPELDVIAPVIRRFAREPRRYVMLFTKSDNVDFLLGLEHGGRTIISWSVTCDSASRLVDRRTASMAERIEAMRKTRAAGYITRARLSPIIPVRDWRREYRELLERMFAAAPPDVVTLELLGWFDYADLVEMIPADLLDPELLSEAQSAADSLRGVNYGPFTERAHVEIYRYCIETVKRMSPRTPVAVCHGTAGVWSVLGELMGTTPGHYVCNCGPTSAPGDAIYDGAAEAR